MKRTALTVLVCLTISIIYVHAQQVSFSGNPVKLESFFSSVSKQTGYVFFYNTTLLGDIPPLSIELKNVSVDSAMHAVLKTQPFIYTIQGKTIFITATKNVNNLPATPNVHVLQKIRGRVTDQAGQPVMGATVYGTDIKNAAVTGGNGDFEIRIKKEDSLTVSCIGYNKIITGTDSNFLVIVLHYNSNPLEQVIVGGNLFASKRRSDISSVTVIDSKTLETLPVTNIADIFRGLVPGTNSFSVGDQTQDFPSLTIRGAGSETSLSQINVYIDGVEWAGGSGYLSALNKENIERIEILRGPESSTLYGTGSNGGIVQIFTKKGNPSADALYATASVGFIQSKWVPSSAFQQYYTLDKQCSFKNVSLLVGGTYQTNGAWLPGGDDNTGTAHLSLKWDPGKKISVNITGYYAGTDRGVSKNPSYDTCIHLPDTAANFGVYPRQLTNKKVEVRSYFAGLNLAYLANARWAHHLTLGFSQNDNHELAVISIDKNGLVPDNFFQSLDKTATIRYSNILSIGKPDQAWAASIMSGADYKNIFYASQVTGSRSYVRDNDPSNTNLGFFAQIVSSYKKIYLTTGLRYDYNKLFGNNHSLNPRVGLTTHFSLAGLTIKPRVSWGSGITAPSYMERYGYQANGSIYVVANPAIKPQEQSGFDYAIEMYDRKNRFSGEVIYYDNTLKNTFAEAGLPPDPNGSSYYQYTNVGAVANRGWEFSGRYKFGSRLSVYGSFSIMHSVIKDSTGDYLSDQFAGRAPGYQLKFLPRHTAGLFVDYQFFRLFRKQDKGIFSFNITEVDGVYGLDGVRYTIDAAYGRAPPFTGSFPDSYWVSNGTIFRLGFNFEYSITGAVRFFAQGSNILNQNNFEQTSSSPTHGASWLFGFKFSSTK